MHKIIEAAETLGGKIAMTIQWPGGTETVEIVSLAAARGLGYHFPDEPAPVTVDTLRASIFETVAQIEAFDRDCEDAEETDVDSAWSVFYEIRNRLRADMNEGEFAKLRLLEEAQMRELALDRLLDAGTITPKQRQERSQLRYDRGVRFVVGETYFTIEGKPVTIVATGGSTGYECVQGDDISEDTGEGIWRYARRGDLGRVTGTDFEFTDSRNLSL